MRRAWLVAVAVAMAAGGAALAGDGAPASVTFGDRVWRLQRSVATASMPWSVRPSPDGASLYVAHVGVGKRHRDNVWRYDAGTLKVEARAAFRGHGVETVFAPGGALYVTNSRAHQLVELDPRTLEVKRAIATDRVPKDVVLSPDGALAYVASWGEGTINVIDLHAGEAVASIRTGGNTRGVAITGDGARVYAMSFAADAVVAIDAERREVIARVKPCANPRHAVVTPDGDHLLVTCYGESRVVAVRTRDHEVARSIDVGRGPKTIALTPDGRFAVTADERSDSMSIIELATWESTTLPLPGDKPCGVAVSPAGDRVYVTARGSHELLELTVGDRTTPRRGTDTSRSSRRSPGGP